MHSIACTPTHAAHIQVNITRPNMYTFMCRCSYKLHIHCEAQTCTSLFMYSYPVLIAGDMYLILYS